MSEPVKGRVLHEGHYEFKFSGFKPGTIYSSAENDLCPCIEGREHCWHRSPIQHAMMNHRDEVCCWCDQSRCVNWMPETPAGHGPHCPTPTR